MTPAFWIAMLAWNTKVLASYVDMATEKWK